MFDEIEALFALKDRFHRWRRSKSGSTDESVASRFIRLFESHGVYPNQIPRFFDHGLRLADVKDASVLLPRLEEPMLEDACRLFAARREWLDGADKQVYPCHDFYKRVDPSVVSPAATSLKARPVLCSCRARTAHTG